MPVLRFARAFDERRALGLDRLAGRGREAGLEDADLHAVLFLVIDHRHLGTDRLVGLERTREDRLVAAEQGAPEVEIDRLDEVAIADHGRAEEEAEARGLGRARRVAEGVRDLFELDRMGDQRNAEQLLSLLVARIGIPKDTDQTV